LSDAGYALGGDVGLLVAKLLTHSHPALRWQVLRAPKSDLSYNLPVLVGFVDKQILEPVGGGIGEARALVKGKRGSDAWAEMYEYWSAIAP
jgi:hypothetical protein